MESISLKFKTVNQLQPENGSLAKKVCYSSKNTVVKSLTEIPETLFSYSRLQIKFSN